MLTQFAALLDEHEAIVRGIMARQSEPTAQELARLEEIETQVFAAVEGE